MGDWVSSDTSRYCAMGTVEQTQNTRGTAIAPGGVNTKGNYGELISSVPFDAHGMLLHISGPLGASNRGLADISLGPAGSEQIIINDIHVDSANNNCIAPFYFSIPIPAGSRIAARIQSSGGATMRFAGNLLSSGFADISPFGKVTTYGADTTDSGGTQIDPGATAGIKGSWTQITASTTAPIVKLLLAIGGNANSARVNSSWLIDVGIGNAGDETILIHDIPLVFSDIYILPKSIGPISVSIPAATRIAVRAQSTNTDTTDRLFDIVLYGIS